MSIGFVSKVYFVFENDYLKKRDTDEFDNYWVLLNCQDKISYHVDIDFVPSPGSLVIIDEADVFIFNNPQSF